MSIRDLFNKKSVSIENVATGSSDIESKDFVLTTMKKNETFIQNVDFASASNFARFGSAYEYYTTSIRRVYDEYPYDGSDKEKALFELSSSFLDKYIFDNLYPKSNGFVTFSYATFMASASPDANGYGTPSVSEREQIFIRGGLHTASSGMEGKPLVKTFSNSIVYDSDKNRTTTFKLNPSSGFTVEFWLKKPAFNTSKTEREVIFDSWNNKTGNDNGRFRIVLDGSSAADTFKFVFRSGSLASGKGVYETTVSDSTVTNASLTTWKHYALSVISGSGGLITRFYVNGLLNKKTTHNANGVMLDIGGLINGSIGSLVAATTHLSPSNQYGGKLSGSLDDFRFWKTRRTSEQIYNNYYTHVGGGTNTDDANTSLGLYYKFNEGIVGNSSYDSVVLDYSGRIANGTWTGYTSGARNAGSAFVLSSTVTSEPKDPIIRSAHPEVTTLLTNLQTSGSAWDDKNTSLLYNRVPSWIREEDESNNKNVKYLFQIMGSYFDTLFLQINEIPKLKEKRFYPDTNKPLPFTERLLKERGLITTKILSNNTLFEYYNGRDKNKIVYEKEINVLKNLIYNNIYNNLDYIMKAKGTESSIRNMMRCFGFDDEIVKLNIYTDNGTHYFTDKSRQTTINKNYVNFNTTNTFNSTIFQTSSTNNTNSFVTGSKAALDELYSAMTVEANIIVPDKIEVHEDGYFGTNFLSSSIFGLHEAGTNVGVYTWPSSEIANFQVYLLRDSLESKNAKFVLTNRSNSFFLTSSLIRDVYENQTWNIAVRVKPQKYPFIGNVVSTSNPLYTIDFYGVNHSFSVVENEFHVSESLSYASGSAFLTRPKRLYIGAHRTNFTGAVAQQSDLKIGSIAFYNDYVSNDDIKQHNLDPMNYGVEKSISSTSMFANGATNSYNSKFDSNVLIWNFQTVTGSDSSGLFTVDDYSSGSAAISSTFPDYLTKAYHKGKGFSFPTSNSSFIKSELVYASKKELPEMAYNSDSVTIETDEKKFFIKDDDVSDNYFSLEKSLYQVVSEEMLNMISSVKEFSNLMGKATDRYRVEYKRVNFIRSMFFDKVEEDLDFDSFTEYFKWIDNSVSYFVSQLFPASARHSKDISDIVESHILERNKYQNKFPLLTRYPSTEGQIKGSSEMRYSWKTGHAPIGGADDKNCVWQKLRKERTDIVERETIRQVINTESTGSGPSLAKADLTIYRGSAFALRRLSKPYRISQDLEPPLHGGINYPPKKNRDVIYHLAQRHGEKGNYGQPLNVVVAGPGTGSGKITQRSCDDIQDPNLKTRVYLDAFAGKYSNESYSPGARDVDSTYSYRLTELDLPVTVISSSVNSGYNSHVVNRFDSGSIVTNIHSDTTSPTNHIPMQGPFTETWVGGHQHRHIAVNRRDLSLIDDDTGTAPLNNLDNKYTRPEGWMLQLGDKDSPHDGAIGIVGPDYGGPYPDPARKVAVFYREERAKRPVNIKNIRYTTGSRNLGNFRENYELISAGGKMQNNLYLRKNPDHNFIPQTIGDILPTTTHPMTLLAQSPTSVGNVFGSYSNNRQVEQVAAVAGAKASGSIKLFGTSSISPSHNENIVLGAGGGFAAKEFWLPNDIGKTTTGEVYLISSGSSDTDLYNSFRTHLQNAYTSSYSVSYTTSPAVLGSAIYQTSSHNVSYLTASVSNFSASSFTLAGWYKFDGTHSGDKRLFWLGSATGNGRHSYAWADQGLSYMLRFRISYTDGGGNQKETQWQLSDLPGKMKNTWAHIALTWQSSSANPTFQNKPVIYINAISQSWSTTCDTYAGGCPSTWGGTYVPNPINQIQLFGDSNGWKGGIDSFQFFNKVLTSAEVLTLYNSRVAPNHSNPAIAIPSSSQCAAWWTMGDHASDPTPVHGQTTNLVNGGLIYDVMGNNNITVKQATLQARRMHWSSGIPQTASYATFSLTASTSTANQNRTIVLSSSAWHPTKRANSWYGSDSSITGGITPIAAVPGNINAIVNSSVTNTIITSRFSAPGGIETSHGYLDAHAKEYSVHNSLNYRNLTVRGTGSGESGTIRVNSQAGRREGLRTSLTRHCGRFGIDSQHGSVASSNYESEASFHKIHRNVGRRPTDTSTIPVPVFNEDHNNAHFSSLLPRSDFQYSWVTSSLGNNYSYKSGKQRIYGYAPTDGIVSSSVSIGGESGFVSAINFPTASEIFGV